MTYPLARALWIAGAVLGVSLLGVVARADAGTRRFAAVAVWAAAGLVPLLLIYRAGIRRVGAQGG